ncbi:MAG: RNA polymerase factor sigma-54 [Firmicutes bacterium]|uniref:RNA polymerase sigma-54 factor n=1 Tax=Sulfobacillus benefaciens TaxID=453960 RepID=A0A2T2X9V5_9FIRM|nr:RNA polymerase factor sigma-54 [Bacillota bacterium]PSR31301.1 MAG: RNA polymerase sigma-54 factor [Sulfobacillus benefaciens]
MLNHHLQPQLNQSQNLALTPSMMLSIKVLTLPGVELADYLQETLVGNPVVEIVYPDYGRWGTHEVARTVGRSDDALVANVADPAEDDLYHFVQQQIAWMLPAGKLRKHAEFIIGNLDQDGYLRADISVLAHVAGITLDELLKALDIVQQCDPAGIGARSLQECLWLQASRRFGPEHDLTRLLRDEWEIFFSSSPSKMSRRLGLSYEEVLMIFRQLRTLEPRPGAFWGGRTTTYLYPDVVAYKDHRDIIHAEVNEEFQPRLRYLPEYVHIRQTTQESQVREFLSACFQQARWAAKALRQRQSTLKKVAEYMVGYQEAYAFRNEPLRSLRAQDLAATLEYHESTLRRAIAGKILSCPKGLIPLSTLLCEPLGSSCDASVDMIKNYIETLIHHENPLEPWSDATITRQLAERGMVLARRTVSKYRQELGYPPASQRKQRNHLDQIRLR